MELLLSHRPLHSSSLNTTSHTGNTSHTRRFLHSSSRGQESHSSEMSLPFDTLKPRGPARIFDNGGSAMVSIYIPDEQFVLKGSEVWLNGRCYGRMGNTDSQATLAREDIVYQRLGSHPHILKYDGKILVREDTYSLKVERALGNLRKLILDCPAPTEQTRLNMAVQMTLPMLFDKAFR